MKKRILILFLTLSLLLCTQMVSCTPQSDAFSSQGESWSMGFGAAEIPLPEDSDQPLYIAGYHAGREIEGVLDLQRASAVWIDVGQGGVLLIGIDCVGLGNDTVNAIRQKLQVFCHKTGCVSVNVYATHTHAGIDTLGLWGPAAQNGKNDAFMANLIDAAAQAAQKAYDDRTEGALYFGSTVPEDLLFDSREPQEYDPALYQLRFVPHDTANNGIRLLSYAAHAESLRGGNTLLSRDFPGAVADAIMQATGDEVMYLPGAIGGLIMTREITEPFDAVENMKQTAKILTDAALSIQNETALSPALAISTVPMEIPLDNTLFFYYKFLGILGNEVSRGRSMTGYLLHSELSVFQMGDVTLALIPGEIFPELVSGQGLGRGDPEALGAIAQRHGVQNLLIVGLCNDELGYIIPPSSYLLNEDAPYIETVTDDMGENHYEETNSTGIATAGLIADAFARALEKLQ